MAEAMRANVAALLRGIDRYNPENLGALERYVEMQAQENVYDREANLAVLKLYQFNPMYFQMQVTATIMMKALTNMPHTDFNLCKCLIEADRFEEEPLKSIMYLAELLETCQFKLFWSQLETYAPLTKGITGFEDSIRKFICHVVSITYQTVETDVLSELLGGLTDIHLRQWVNKYGWRDVGGGLIEVASQEENIKTKNITEKIVFESVAGIMAAGQGQR